MSPPAGGEALRHFLFCGLSAAGIAAAIGFLCACGAKAKAAGSVELSGTVGVFVLVAGIYF